MTNAESFSEWVQHVRHVYSPLLLAGQVALVTGGSRGIGRAIAICLGAVGATVIVNYAGNEAAAADTVGAILAAGGKGVSLGFSVADPNQVAQAIAQVEKDFGAIDILINNAGISKDQLVMRFKNEDWQRTLDTNLSGAFYCAKSVSMGMIKKRKGKIINMSSVVGLMGSGGQTAYAASKAGLIGFTKSLAHELSSRNIQVNAVAPGYIDTDMTQAMDPKVVEMIKSKIPMGRTAQAMEVALAVVFLVSPAASYITGHVLTVDGGMTMY